MGDATETPFQTEDGQYQMKYFQSGSAGASYLKVEWTDQHGCGGNENTDPTKQNCMLALQYMCQPATDYASDNLDRVRDGLNTQTQDYSNMAQDTPDGKTQRKTSNVKLDRVLQETWDSYDQCNYRERNKGDL